MRLLLACFMVIELISARVWAVGTIAPESRGSRLFSLAITPPQIENIADFWKVYEDAVGLAIDTGIDLPGELSFIWSEIESKSLFGTISYADESSLMAIEILQRKNLPVVITLMPFDSLSNRIPSDLQHLPLDHPKLIERLKLFIDWVYKATAGLQPVAVVLGNEFDLYLDTQLANGNDQWPEFERLALAVKSHVKALPRWQSALFAIETTYSGLMGPSWLSLQRINRHAEVIGVSYYPMGENVVEPPIIIETHLNELFRVYPDKPIHFYQYGYPSSEKLNSSEEKQRQFIEETFRLWDKYQDRVRLVTFTWLYDIQPANIEAIGTDVLGGLSPSAALAEFLGSLGLHRRKVGEEKPAFAELKKQLAKRAWSK